MATWIWILIAVVAVAVLAVAGRAAARQRRTASLRTRFGPEYDRAVRERGDRRAAEAELLRRQRERERLDIQPLPEPTRMMFARKWSELQEGFVDKPADAVFAADTLVTRVMEARGYPMGEFAAKAGLVSVDHPGVVASYRFAHDVCERARAGQAGTEDLREALLHYRSLFGELLRPGRPAPRAAPPARTTPARTTPARTTPARTTADGTTADGSTADGSTADGTTADGTTPAGSTADGSAGNGAPVPGTAGDGGGPVGGAGPQDPAEPGYQDESLSRRGR